VDDQRVSKGAEEATKRAVAVKLEVAMEEGFGSL